VLQHATATVTVTTTTTNVTYNHHESVLHGALYTVVESFNDEECPPKPSQQSPP
jgi:hypothetical protein